MPWLFHRWLLFYCISVITIQGCRCFFLRHTSSGKCIAAEKLTFWTESYGIRYWAVLLDCSNVTAQLRYLQGTEALHNIAKKGVVTFIDGSRYRNRMLIFDAKPKAGNFESDPRHNMKQKAAGSLYFYDAITNSCAESDSNERYIDQKNKGCSDTEEKQKFTFGSVTKFGDKMKDVHCSPIQRMVIHKAHYGDFNNSGIFNSSATIDKNCSHRASCQVKSLCGGNISCELKIDNNLLPSQYCSDTTKDLYIEYTCVDNYMKPITTAPEIRLSKSPNEGFIEVKIDSTRRKVKEEIWDKTRENSLCQHLGFSGTVGNVVNKTGIETGQDIVSGDLCYDANQNDPCCVNLYRSTTTSNVNAPYVICKMCENALLQNKTKFPDRIFSGSGSTDNTKYKEARFSSDGWCSTESGDKYLKIDLQNEYRITRVMVMGDKDQTMWSRSYSLKYSHNESLVDGSTEVQIKGNQHSYQASTTDVDIYNVRYIKIQSTESAYFCLRIELCGEVQSLAPVQNIVAKPSNFSVHLSWTIPSPVISTYITHFIIYLNGTEIHRISRAHYGNQYILQDLKPYTGYVFGIKTQNGNLKNTQPIVYHNFKTTEAVPSGPPRSVVIKSRSENSLEISWKAPDKIFWNGELTRYRICFSTKENDKHPKCLNKNILSDWSYTIPNLQPLTNYFVTVSVGTRVGYGNKSLEISEMTNAEPVNFVVMSHLDIGLKISKPASNIREVMIIVQKATSTSTTSKNIKKSKLGAYQNNTYDPYVTAFLKTDDLPLTFVIGDGKEYNSETGRYFNKPFTINSSYIVFLRYFDNQNTYYSTEWSSSFSIMGKAPVGMNSRDSEQSSEEKTRIELLIPLAILALCFLISLCVIVYQRRLLQNKKREMKNDFKNSKQMREMKEFGSIPKEPQTNEGAEFDKEAQNDTRINCVSVYETPDDVIGEIERNKAVCETAREQESSDYMSLKDNREPPNVYQALQPPATNGGQSHPNGGGQSVEYQNPAFNEDSSGA